MRTSVGLALAFALSLVAVTGGAALAKDTTAKAPEMAPADVAKWLGFFDKLVATVVKSSSTCDKLAADVNAVIDANQDAVDVARAAHAQGKKLPKDAQQKMMEGVKKMVPGMQKCGQHGKVRAAFAKLDLTKKPAAARRGS